MNEIINYIILKCVDLKNKYVSEKNLDADYICIFSQSEAEYQDLVKQAATIGEIVDETKTGPLFKFIYPPQTIAGKPKVLKIRIPDPTKKQRGDVDFTTNYQDFKDKYFDDDKFKLIVREKFEMLELADQEFDVLVYFSRVPPSQLAGVS
ncbi:hypothetical protein HY310_03705 [Candidatus Microgenomates bacterium]|nr:hypothetical protein [Candidatus Microgenomates bacterium]